MTIKDISKKLNVKYSSVQYIMSAYRKMGHTNRSCNHKEKLALQNILLKKEQREQKVNVGCGSILPKHLLTESDSQKKSGGPSLS